jgi:hypothetical protein
MKNSTGFFAVSGNKLVTAFSGSISPGIYSVRVRALDPTTSFSASAIFNVDVTTPLPPAPPTIAVNGLQTGAIVASNTAMSIVVAGGPETERIG